MRVMKKTIILTLIVLTVIGLEANERFIESLSYTSWFVPVCIIILIVLALLFVFVSCTKALKERKLEVNAGQFFAEYIPRLDPEEQDLHIILGMGGGRSLEESDVFTVETKVSKWSVLRRFLNRRKHIRRRSHG